MDLAELVERDIASVAKYWWLRKFQYLEHAQIEFELLVEPAIYRECEPSTDLIMLNNQSFSEWMLFDWVYQEGETLLERYIGKAPRGATEEHLDRLEQVAETEFFSRFIILDKEPENNIVLLQDIQSNRRYRVGDERASHVDRWRDGTLGMRIALVDGCWLHVGQCHFYDVASPEHTMVDGPGCVHAEDLEEQPWLEGAAFFARFLHDVLGERGRYSDTIKVRSIA